MELREVIKLLGDGRYHSGEELGEHFGVSRTAIWKQLKKLEVLGVRVEAIRGLGYRLESPVELLDGNIIVGLLDRSARQRLTRLFVEMQIDSTNSFLLSRFKQGAGHGEVCFAERQDVGRGRRGRAWQAALGEGLTFSMGWRFNVQAAELQGLSLAVGVAIAKAFDELNVNVELKWPNDILIRDKEGSLRKLGGVLVELQGDAEGPCDVVVGIGLNVSSSPEVPEGAGLPSGYVEQVSQGSVSRNKLSAILVDHVGKMLESYIDLGFGFYKDDWDSRNAMANQLVNVHHGDSTYKVKVCGIDGHGSLLVEREGIMERLTGGEISLRPAK